MSGKLVRGPGSKPLELGGLEHRSTQGLCFSEEWREGQGPPDRHVAGRLVRTAVGVGPEVAELSPAVWSHPSRC